MASSRGLMAEFKRQMRESDRRAQQAEKKREQQQRAAIREQEKQAAAARRAQIADEKERERQVKQARIADGQAKAELMNSQLHDVYEDIDNILLATLIKDDFIDLESLKTTTANYPHFTAPAPLPDLDPLVYPDQPVYQEPAPPSGLSAKFGGEKRYAQALQAYKQQYHEAYTSWQNECQRMYDDYMSQLSQHQQKQQRRLEEIDQVRQRYEAECKKIDDEIAERNGKIDEFINAFAFDMEWAIDEYIGLVLANSEYPDAFPVTHEWAFNLTDREATVTVTVPPPSAIPTVKQYKYVASKDEISETQLSQKMQKDRYAGAVGQTGLRTLHEIFEADRNGKIQSISLNVRTEALDPAVGIKREAVLLEVSTTREKFTEIQLSEVVPAETLKYLGTAMSKNPLALEPISGGKGVRKAKT